MSDFVVNRDDCKTDYCEIEIVVNIFVTLFTGSVLYLRTDAFASEQV